MSTGQIVALTFGLAGLTTFGDYFLKLASMEVRPLHNKWFFAGCFVYVLGAFGWVFAFQHLKLATVGIIYAVATVLFLTVLGVLFFGESLSRHEMAGIGFGVLSITLLARFA